MIPAMTTTTLDPGVMLTPPEAAAVLRISLRTLRKHTSTGDIPAHRIGRSVRYQMAELADSMRRDM